MWSTKRQREREREREAREREREARDREARDNGLHSPFKREVDLARLSLSLYEAHVRK